MDIDVARHVIRVAFRSAAELQALLGILKERCEAEEYKSYAIATAAAIDGINVALTNRVLSSHPELTNEIEANLSRSGRAMP
jgi:hypothetical protein